MDTTDLISISDASKLGVSGLVRLAEEGHDLLVVRNDKPVAAVVSMERFERLQELQGALLDVAVMVGRMATSGPNRHPLNEVLARFGYTREQLPRLAE